MTPLRILYLARRYPHPLTSGGNWRTFGFVQGLSKRAEVTLACFGTGPPLDLPDVRVVPIGHRPGSRRVVGCDMPSILAANLRELDPRLPLQVRLSLDGRMRRLVQDELRTFRPHVVHVSPSTMAPFLPGPGTCHRHLDLNDSLALSMETQAREASVLGARALRLEARLLRRYEARAAVSADSCSISAEADMRAVPGLGPENVLAPGVDLAALPFEPPVGRGPVAVFFGNLGYPPNVHAAEFVVENVWPHVLRERPDAELQLVGARGGPDVARLSLNHGVRLVGRVDHMRDALHKAAVAILPSRSGAGIKTKVQEAFSAGTPVVSNQLGIDGVPGLVADRHALVRERAEELATACVELFADEEARVRLAGAARSLIEDCSWDAQVERLLGIYAAGGLSVGAARVASDGGERT